MVGAAPDMPGGMMMQSKAAARYFWWRVAGDTLVVPTAPPRIGGGTQASPRFEVFQ